MGWPEARTEFASIFSGLAVTSPPAVEAGTLERVYDYPPKQIQDEPAMVLEGSSLDEEWSAGTARELYELSCAFLLRDEDIESAIQDLEAWRAAIQVVLRANVTLSGNVQVTGGPSFDPEQLFDYAGKSFAGFRFSVPIVISGPGVFAAGS